MKRFLAAVTVAGALTAAGSAASAQSIIRQPGAHVDKVEFEIHGVLGFWGRWYNTFYTGPGFRVGIPIVRNGFVRSINNSVAINFGADFFWYPGYSGFGDYFAISSPVVAQWNFYLTGKWSVFGEAGVAFEFYPWDGPNCRGGGCDRFWVYPGLAAGARYHFRGGTTFPSLTMRLGFPTGFNIGVSF